MLIQDEAAAAPAAGAAASAASSSFDDFSIYFVRLVVVTIWFAYLWPIISKFVDKKQSNWQKKLKSGCKLLRGPKAVKDVQ